MRINQALNHWSASSSVAEGRCSGFTCTILLMRRLADQLTAPSSRQRSFPEAMRRQSSSSFPARKGKAPTSSRQRMTPSAHTSALAPLQGSLRTSSGHMQAGVPQKLVRGMRELALKPKSMSLTCPWSSMRMFSGLRSRWQMPFRWQQSTPSSTSLKYFLAFASEKAFSFLSSPAKLCFPAFSMTRYSLRLSLTKSTSLTTRGLSSIRRWRISRLMQASLFQSRASIFSQVLTAQLSFSRPTASETTENAPFPMCDITFSSFRASPLESSSSKQLALSPRSLLVPGRDVTPRGRFCKRVAARPTDTPLGVFECRVATQVSVGRVAEGRFLRLSW